jgi:hypothetical protein
MIYYYFLESVAAQIKPIEGRLREGETLYLTCDGKGYPTPLSSHWKLTCSSFKITELVFSNNHSLSPHDFHQKHSMKNMSKMKGN